MPVCGFFRRGGEMSWVKTEQNEFRKNRFFLYKLMDELYIDTMSQAETRLHIIVKNLSPYQDIGMLLLKFNKLIYGVITEKELRRLRRQSNNVTLLINKIPSLMIFIAQLRKLFTTLNIGSLHSIGVGSYHIEVVKDKIIQVNDNVFLELYRALMNLELELELTFSDIQRIAVQGGAERAKKIKHQKQERLRALKIYIESMSHTEILDLLSTKQNCFNKLVELDYKYQQNENTITKSKLSLQYIKSKVENQDGTYNLASTSAGRWIVKNMPKYFWTTLKNKRYYELYLEISWFKEYLSKYI